MSDTGLVVLNNQSTELAPQGLGYTGTSKLFELKPATLGIVQPNSTIDGANKGNLIVDGDPDMQFKEMRVTLLTEPQEQRAYYIGNAADMNRTPENLHCFSRDMLTPDKKSKFPQAYNCKGCPKASWEQFRAKKDKNIPTTKEDIPPCDPFYYALLIDTEYKMPLQLFVRSTSRDPFEQGMKRIARKLAMRAAVTGKTPNIFDVSFKLSTKLVTKGKFQFYILDISDVQGVEDEDKAQFGVIFQKVTEQQLLREQKALEASTETQQQDAVVATSQEIDNAVLDPEYVDTEDAEISI